MYFVAHLKYFSAMYKIALIVLNVRPLWVYKRNIIQL